MPKTWIFLVTLLSLLFTLIACGGGMGFFEPVRPAGTPEDAECRMSAGGETVCGYDCRMGSLGDVACADTPDGQCSMDAFGSVSCTQKLAPVQDDEVEWTVQPSTDNNVTTTNSSDAYCCVNGAFYQCPGASEAAVCLGEPMQMISCMQNCPMMGDGSCENQCAADYGPRPQDAGCSRTAARDGDCSRH